MNVYLLPCLLLLTGCVTTVTVNPKLAPPAATEAVDPGTLINFDDAETSEQELRALAEDASGPYKLEVLTQVARAQGLQGRYDEAHATLDQVEATLPEAGSLVRIRYLLERGRVFNSSGDTDAAAPLFEQAFELGTTHGPAHLTIDAAHMVAIASQGTPAELTWGLKGLALAEASDDPRARSWLGPLYNNLGWTYHDQGEFDKALDLFQKGLAIRRKDGDEGATYLARWAVARCLRSLGRYQKALDIQTQLEAEGARRGEPDGYVFEELGELYLVKGDADAARAWFQRALVLLEADEWLVANERERIERIRELAGGAADTQETAPGTRDDPSVEENGGDEEEFEPDDDDGDDEVDHGPEVDM